jgi:hypothetical protein
MRRITREADYAPTKLNKTKNRKPSRSSLDRPASAAITSRRDDPLSAILPGEGDVMTIRLLYWNAGLFLLLGLPWAGILATGLPVDRYLEFPPHTKYIEHAAFSWPVFAALALAEIAAILLAVRTARCGAGPCPDGERRFFPWWGWLSLGWIAAWWGIAWTRQPVLALIQGHTFTPLWLGYIVAVNALTYARSGRSLLTHRPRYLLALFPWSAGFWWFFEYLNRFVQNWMYEGVAHWSALEYFILATLSFSTVLPAVLSTEECLRAFGLAHRADDRPAAMPGSATRAIWLVISVASLAFLAAAPNYLFPFLWLAPLGLLMLIYPKEHIHRVFPSVGTLLRFSAAALVCGFFWELWNLHSLAKWVYFVPFVQKFHLFEMPILGYFGYLPFGWECAWLASLVRPQ